jgi:hypothetical protein
VTRFVLAMAFAGTVAACDDLSGTEDVEVRLENASPVTMSTATLYTSEGPQTFQDLGPGNATPYVPVTTAYRIATTEVVIQDDTLRLQVIDFVGEEPLPGGRYSYVLAVHGIGSAHLTLSQELREDD